MLGASTTSAEPVLRGWVNYYRHAAANRAFAYLDYYVWWRVGRWLRKKHPRMRSYGAS